MITFEQELVNAIRHIDNNGCPICGDLNRYLDATANLHEGRLEMRCVGCGSTLYQTGGGWIPELADIVKGE